MTARHRKAEAIDEVLALYEKWGSARYDEEIGQLDHALQTAALAVAEGVADALVAAALLHDVGHLLELESAGLDGEPTRDLRHESIGATYLGGLFPPEVTTPIALHVRAKRYLCAVDVEYHDALSAGSRRSLTLQGGPLTAGQAAAFERVVGWDAAVCLRRWDDGGKVADLAVPPLEDHRGRLARLAG